MGRHNKLSLKRRCHYDSERKGGKTPERAEES